MGLFDDYVDPQQFESGGGLLGRLLALKQAQNQNQPVQSQPFAPQDMERGAPWQRRVSYDRAVADGRVTTADSPAGPATVTAALGPYSPIPDPHTSDTQKVGIPSNESIYCRTMSNLCHNECVDLALQRDGIGPYRACVRECMHRAGCFDF